MYNHEPENYDCPFCKVASGLDNPDWNYQSDVIFRDAHVTAFISPMWWEKSRAHAIIVPNQHIENIYDMTPDVAVYVYELARQIAIAFKQVYQCDGTSTRQHNEPAGYQEVFHYHLHVFPRYQDDNLYREDRRMTTREERLPYAEKLRAYFASLKD